MVATPKRIHHCPTCGKEVAEGRYVLRSDGSFRCEHCYFQNTYLDGVVHQIDTAHLMTLEAFVSAIDAREHEVGNHSLRVTQYSLVIANACGVSGRELVDIYCGALLHDIGKIGVPDVVLFKQGPLAPEELQVMHRHPEIGYRIVSHIGYFSQAAEIIRSHHEHFDGTGYPRNLRADGIPHGARVFSVADALDALTVKRPYRDAVSFEQARELIMREERRIYDPSVIGGFRRAADELKEMVGTVVLTESDLNHNHR